MKAAILRRAVWALLPALSGCVFETAGGNGSETTNHLVGVVEGSDGKPAARVIVSAVPTAFNPLTGTLPAGLIDTTDGEGRFDVRNPAAAAYQLEFLGPDGNRAWQGGVDYYKGRLDLGRVRLRKSGAIRIGLPGSFRASGGFLFIPGSTYHAVVSEGSQTLLDSLPQARLPALAFTRALRDTAVLIARDLVIPSADTADLSVADTIALPREALFNLRTTAAGADVPEDVLGFPLLLRLDSSNFDFAKPPAEYAALAFYQDGKTLPYEVESWDSLGRKADIWIRANVRGNTDSQYVLMRWGKAGSLESANGAPTFDSGAGFAGVYHFASDPCECKNSANSAKPAKPINFDGDERIDGLIGPALRLDSARTMDGSFVNDILDMGDLGLGTKVTLSAWVRLGAWPEKVYTYDYILGQNIGSADTTLLSYGLYLGSDTTAPFLRATVGTQSFGGPDSLTIPSGTNPIVLGAWNLLQGTFDGLVLSTYVNGKRIHSQPASFPGNPATGDLSTFLGFPDSGAGDEIRVERTARSATWIKLSYENQKAGQSLIERIR